MLGKAVAAAENAGMPTLLDARTLHLEMFATCVVLGVAELVFYLRRLRSHGIGWWALANPGAALGTLLIGLRGYVPAI